MDEDAINAAVTDVVRELSRTPQPATDLALAAATPLRTLPPDLVALIVGRVQAGSTALGPDHPRATITRRIVVPSAVLAVLDAVGLVAAAVTGHDLLAVVAGALLILLAYLAFAGVRFVRTDPLRVTREQRAFVDAAKTWRSAQPWTDDQHAGPWTRLVEMACAAVARIAASEAWTWPSVADQRAEIELASTLDEVDAEAFAQAAATTGPPTPDAAGADLVRRVAALRCYADALDDLVRRAASGADVRAELPRADDQRLADLLRRMRVRP